MSTDCTGPKVRIESSVKRLKEKSKRDDGGLDRGQGGGGSEK